MKASKNNKYCVYIHINKLNNKKYVGLTSKIPQERWNNGNGYKSNKHFYNAILKYGWENFEHLIIAENLIVNEACKIEKDLILKYQSNNPKFGYNICSGGEINILPQSSLEKISKKNKGRKMSKEVMMHRALNPPKAKKVICDNIKFISITECAKFYNIRQKEMQEWVNGIKPFNESFKNRNLHLEGTNYIYEECYSKRKWVFYDNKEYKSIAEFSRFMNIPYDTIMGWVYKKYNVPQKHLDKGFKVESKKFYKIKYI